MQAPNDERLKDAVAELKEGPRELVDLYNEYACPWQQWGLALEMVEIANYSDAAYVRQLWDIYLRQARSPLLLARLGHLSRPSWAGCSPFLHTSHCIPGFCIEGPASIVQTPLLHGLALDYVQFSTLGAPGERE